jgi:ketosteroid isomerase-like protein
VTAIPTSTATAEFVEFFATGWAIGAHDAEGFFRHFEQRLHPDAVMLQPVAPRTRGTRALRQLFGPLFRAVPDLTGEVQRWGATDDGVFIELTLRGSLGGRPLEWTVVDRIVLEDGLIRERRSYFDSLPLLKPMAMRPQATLPLLVNLVKEKITSRRDK